MDDDAELREIVGMCLELEGYAVAMAGNGEAALAYLRGKRPPGLILLDRDMPVMDGPEFLNAFQGLGLPTPIVMFSAGEITRDARVGAFLVKPFELDELTGTIARLCQPNGIAAEEG